MLNKKIFAAVVTCFFIPSLFLSVFAQKINKTGERGLITLSANPPAGTKAVRFFIDGMQAAELTNQYALKTNTNPVWETVIDPAWLEKGEHELRIDAETEQGLKTLETKKITGTKANTANNISLTGAWDFAEESELPAGALVGDAPPATQPGYTGGTWTKILAPHSLGSISDKWNKYEGLIGVYRRTENISFSKNEQAAIVLESVYWYGRVFINGIAVGETRGGYVPSRFDISKALKPGKNEIAIIVDNRFTTMGNLKRINEFYWNWGGILQELRIEKNPLLAFTQLRAEGSMKGKLKLHITGLNATGGAQRKNVTIDVYDEAGKKVAGPFAQTVNAPEGTNIIALKDVQVNNVVNWDMDHPHLYTVVVKGDFGTIQERTGFRDVVVKGSDILLNGQVIQGLQGFNRHADFPGLGRTQPGGLAYRELKMYRDKGFRFFRPAHYPTTTAQLDAADELGLLVIEEVNVTGLRGVTMATTEVKEFGTQQLTKMINRDRSHPSIIAWSVGNENFTEEDGAVEYVSEVIKKGRSMDSLRLYTQVTHRHTTDKTFQFQDFVAQNYYAGWYAKDINAIVGLFDAIQSYSGNKPVMLSEYGAEAVPFKEGVTKSTEFYQGFVVDAHNRLLNNRKHFFGKMYWCTTDFWCRPNWTGGSPEPIPPFHVKSLISISRDHKKLGWRVIFSPVRLIPNPHTVKANDLGGDILVPLDKDTTINQVITVKEIKGRTVKGKITVQGPKGFECSVKELPFELKPEEGMSFKITLKGTLTSTAKTADMVIRAVIDEDTEAQPLLIVLRPKE